MCSRPPGGGGVDLRRHRGAGCGSWTPFRRERYVAYCAMMPDSVGLYVGNPVTQMGFKIGEVSAITPALRNVRVDFKVIRAVHCRQTSER